MKELTNLFIANAVFIEEMYHQYLKNPNLVDDSWRAFFINYKDNSPILKTIAKIIDSNFSENQSTQTICVDQKINQKIFENEIESYLKIKFIITSYRLKGHYLSKLDPLNMEKISYHPNLDMNYFGLNNTDLNKIVKVNGMVKAIDKCTISELLNHLNKIYSGSIGVEFEHIENNKEKEWLYEEFENLSSNLWLSNDMRKNLLNDLSEIESFEQFLHKKFPGAKRFSIEGGESVIVSLDNIINLCAEYDATEVILGLAHRGRLSSFVKVLQKPYRAIFSEFAFGVGFDDERQISWDVKYHLGYSSDRITKSGKKIHLSLTPNPSHLESVNGVVAGKVRSKQDSLKDIVDKKKIIGILVHGDAAFAGQGVVAENLAMSALKSYNVNGIIHIIINNQIGFTACGDEYKSSRYCTEIAKVVNAPIIHINGDDPESVLLATKIAVNYRYKFGKDIILDIVCYRKYGHNEADEPMYTQSVMYNVIKNKLSPAKIYSNILVDRNVIDENYYKKLSSNFKIFLDNEFSNAKKYNPDKQWLQDMWSGFVKHSDDVCITGVEKSLLKELGEKLCTIPIDFDINSKLQKLFDQRLDFIKNEKTIDWATAEQLAFATLLLEKVRIRLSGQDSKRGTFSQRHAVLYSQSDNSPYEPLNNLSSDQAFFEVINSNLSEYGALIFEYGYSLVDPKNLVIWEAQFGDFANGAQIVFDQFISSSEAKWMRMSGIVVFLPHGYEGQGPEHSSARLERFLQLAAENNIQVTYPTTPASIFHLLRRQMKRNYRKPLIVMTPKSLLREKLATSSLNDISEGTKFHPIIDDVSVNIKPESVISIIFCTGKVYYDILKKKNKEAIENIVIVRFEELYPFPADDVNRILKKYFKVKNIVWCQEEPQNMGAWSYINNLIMELMLKQNYDRKIIIKYAGRPSSASPAVGNIEMHNIWQERLVEEAFCVLN